MGADILHGGGRERAGTWVLVLLRCWISSVAVGVGGWEPVLGCLYIVIYKQNTLWGWHSIAR